MKTDQLIEKLTQALYCKYSDKIAPGITIAALKDNQYYCSVLRYPGGSLNSKVIICSAYGNGMCDALWKVSEKFINVVSKESAAIAELHNFMFGNRVINE